MLYPRLSKKNKNIEHQISRITDEVDKQTECVDGAIRVCVFYIVFFNKKGVWPRDELT